MCSVDIRHLKLPRKCAIKARIKQINAYAVNVTLFQQLIPFFPKLNALSFVSNLGITWSCPRPEHFPPFDLVLPLLPDGSLFVSLSSTTYFTLTLWLVYFPQRGNRPLRLPLNHQIIKFKLSKVSKSQVNYKVNRLRNLVWLIQTNYLKYSTTFFSQCLLNS